MRNGLRPQAVANGHDLTDLTQKLAQARSCEALDVTGPSMFRQLRSSPFEQLARFRLISIALLPECLCSLKGGSADRLTERVLPFHELVYRSALRFS